MRDDILVRTDAASVEQCLEACLPRLRELGFSFPGDGDRAGSDER
ncbi:hypothetical protein [Streptomyces sp. NPDC096012]